MTYGNKQRLKFKQSNFKRLDERRKPESECLFGRNDPFSNLIFTWKLGSKCRIPKDRILNVNDFKKVEFSKIKSFFGRIIESPKIKRSKA